MDNETLSILVPIPIIVLLIVCVISVIRGRKTAISEAEIFDYPDNPTQYSCDRSSMEPGDKFYVYGFRPHESVNGD